MKAIRVTYTNGNTIKTNINGTDAEIRAYYLNKNAWFNLGTGDGPDVMVRASRVEFLNADGTVRPLDPQNILNEASMECNATGLDILCSISQRLSGRVLGASIVALRMPESKFYVGDNVIDRDGFKGSIHKVTHWEGSVWYDVEFRAGQSVRYDSDLTLNPQGVK